MGATVARGSIETNCLACVPPQASPKQQVFHNCAWTLRVVDFRL